MRFLSAIFALGIAAILSINAYAGGPFYTAQNSDGQWVPLRWPGDTLEWYVDTGPLSSTVDPATAKQWVQEQLNKWTSISISNSARTPISTTTIKTVFKGSTTDGSRNDVDMDASNFTAYYGDSTDSRTLVIFDKDGAITASLGFDKNSTVGLSTPLESDDTGLIIKKGVVILNGLILENHKMTEGKFKAAILHELGHLLNLDHSMTNYDIAKACNSGADCSEANYIPTMYPVDLSESQGILGRDDMITLSWIAPSDDFKKEFCTITGKIYDAKDKHLKGVHVSAIRVGDGETASKVDVRAFVSGAMAPECAGDSSYYLHGIVPGYNYQVTYEPIGSEFRGASGFEPLQDSSPTGFEKGKILSPDGGETVSCDEGGKTIEMASVAIDVTNPCNKTETGESGGAQTISSSSKCSLFPLGRGSWQFPAVCIMVALFAMLMVRSMKARNFRNS